MHPEIRKFWEDAGYEIEIYSTKDKKKLAYGYKGLKSPNQFNNDWSCATLMFGNQYRFNGNWLSEEDLLKIIKLKAFI